MSIINCKIFTPLSDIASPKMGLETAAIFGALAPAIGSIAGAGGQVLSNLSTNAANEALTREGWQLQQAEAAKSRQFNSVEAQKAREYYSESAVMERRRQAGLNTALDGSSSATSGASASASPGSISSPIPMQALDAIPLGNGLSQAISNYFGFKQADLQGHKVSAETQKILQDIVHDKAMHEVSIAMNTQNLENLKKLNEELTIKNDQLRNATRLEHLHVNEFFNGCYNDWVTTQMAKDNVIIEGGKFILMYEKDRAKIMANARNVANQLKLQKTDLEYKYGGRHRVGSSFDQNSSNSNGSGLSVNGKYNASASAHGRVPLVAGIDATAGIEIGGQYSSSQQKSTAEMVGISTSSEQSFANTDIGKVIAEVEGALIVLESPDSSDAIIRNAIDVLLRANYSLEAFMLYYDKLDRFASSRSPMITH